MRKSIILGIVSVFWLSVSAQKDLPYTFTEVVNNDATETKDQCNTGTCWSFSTTSFVESELIRMGKGSHNLSEMYNVRMTYPRKAELYVRNQGKAQFGPGSLNHDVLNVIADHGIVPESAYDGLEGRKERHDHGEMDAVLLGIVESVVNKRGSISNRWMDAVNAVLDIYLGEVPGEFEYEGKKYTPASFRDKLGFNANDYIKFTSFTHHPFYKPFILEVPDNFSQASFNNITIDEMVNLVKSALKNGYTIAWDADVSEKGFSFRNGMAIVPPDDVAKDQLFAKVVDEPAVDQALRQAGFDDRSTTDDHLMHITGIAKDQNGKEYFITKNSWGTGNMFDGYQYISIAYFKLKTIGIVLHTDALSSDLKKKCGI